MLERTDYLKNHWQGTHSIPRVVWINLFTLSLIISVLLDLAPKHLSIFENIFGLLVLNLLLIWQVIGAFRTLRAAIKNKTDIIPILLLSIAIPLISTSSIWRSVEIIYPTPVQTQIIASAEKPTLNVSDDGTRIFIKGDINYPLHASFLHTLEHHDDIQTVVLSSSGGIIFAARAIALKITELGLNTKVDENCFSACTLIFLSGEQRILGAAGQLGFHLYATKSMLTASILDIKEQVEKDKQYLRIQGVSESFIKKAYSTPPNQIWIPTPQQLENSGVLAK